MGTAIIIVILVVVCVLGVRSSIRHYKGEGGCCGGGDPVPKAKKKKINAVYRKTMTIEGMHCDNCKNNVERHINEIEGASAKVNLKKKQALVEMDREIPEEVLVQAVVSAGYEVTEIK